MSTDKIMEEIYNRTVCLIGQQAQTTLLTKKVVLIGLGGVGSYVAEALARAGVGTLILADPEKIESSNINRQLFALHSTIGLYKINIAHDRIKDINPNIKVICYEKFVCSENISTIIDDDVDYVIDAIDSVQCKIDIIKYATSKKLNIISCMGTGNKLDNTSFKIANISKTDTCPLAKKIRKVLNKEGITDVDVLYSSCKAIKTSKECIASISYVPSTAGLLIAGYVIQKMIEQ